MDVIWKNKYLLVLTVLLIGQTVLYITASHGDAVRLRQPLKQFPQSLPGWLAVSDGVIDQVTVDMLKADDILSRFYVRMPVAGPSQLTRQDKATLVNGSTELFMEYFSTQQEGQSPHSPKNCLPGAGWQPVVASQITIAVPEAPRPITINLYIVSRGDAQSVVLYWYQSHGRIVAREFAAKFYLVADSVRYHRSDTALIRILAPIRGNDVDRAVKNGTDLVRAAYPAILKFLPR